MIQNEDGRFKILACVDFRISRTGTRKSSFLPLFVSGKVRVKPWKKLLEICAVLFCISIEITEDSVNFKTNHSVLRKQGWIFRNLHNFHIILARKKKVKRRISKINIFYIFLVRYEQNQSWNIQEGIRRCFSQLWRYRRIYKTENSGNMWSKKTSAEEVINFFIYIKACVFSVIACC